MLDRFKEFIGIDDKYDDYDEDQLYYDDLEEEVKKKTAINLRRTKHTNLISLTQILRMKKVMKVSNHHS